MKRMMYQDPSIGVMAATALLYAATNMKRKPVTYTAAQIAKREKLSEIEEWNRQVEERKAAKKARRSQTRKEEK